MLFVGLGNPGKEYENTRHNVGFLMADEIVRHYNFSDYKSKYKAEFSEGEIAGKKIYIVKPQTFMNNSGISVSEIARFYKIPLNDIYVFYDELDIPVGKFKVKKSGGSGGHNGIKSIDSHIGKDYYRMRIGIDHPRNINKFADNNNVSSYVLNKFSDEDRNAIDKLLNEITKNLPVLIKQDHVKFLTKLHLDKNKKTDKPDNKNPAGDKVGSELPERGGVKNVVSDKSLGDVASSGGFVNNMAEKLKNAFDKKSDN